VPSSTKCVLSDVMATEMTVFKGRRIRGRELPLTLVSVYRLPKLAPRVLYALMQEREPHVNISHRIMPTWRQHMKFIASRPYSAWYLIRLGKEYIGAIYLTTLSEIGIFVLARWRHFGVGPRAIRTLMRRHKRERYLANVNPRNEISIRLFRHLGFKIIQQTYELRTRAVR
jgi:RimJ/RimL family protein N-acetyltransferase